MQAESIVDTPQIPDTSRNSPRQPKGVVRRIKGEQTGEKLRTNRKVTSVRFAFAPRQEAEPYAARLGNAA